MDVRAVPGGDLQQHARGVRLHLRARAAHHARDRRRALGVLDHDHLGVERARLAVERVHLLALPRAAHRQAPAGDAVEVERVQRLAGQQHRVVGDVDHVVDRPLPGRHQPRLQPRRRWRDRDVLEHARGEARAELGTLDRHLARAVERPRPPGGARGPPAHGGRATAAPRWRRAARAPRRTRRGSPAGWA